ncbi:MAG: hypothetical protein BWY15_00531 [Firmicutes bacterium ADurb.Bin193]|nr:MAG: hypothetical protein BWY15_00531 [Firmicutes bacterium ADurb.Bin193]
MKKAVIFTLAIMLCFSGFKVTGEADIYGIMEQSVVLKIGSPKAFVNMSEVPVDSQNPYTAPFVSEGRTLVPVRFVAESFGAAVDWDEHTRIVSVKTGSKSVLLPVNSDSMIINEKVVPLDVGASLVGDRAFIPIRRLAEDVLGKNVFYDRGLIIIGDSVSGIAQGSEEVGLILAMFKTQIRAPYMVYYGSLDEGIIETAKTYKIVILHPSQARLERNQIMRIQQGINPDDPSDDVKVIGYISIGEDTRTTGMTPQQMRDDPRFTGDKTGPRVDPRGVFPNGNPNLAGIGPKGVMSGGGFASYYLDDNDFDGNPDFNRAFNGAFVNAGDPAWYDALSAMTFDSIDGVYGLREILTLDYGRGLGCDGVFLDTIDTCAPNSYTDASSFNQSEFEWTAPGFLDFIKRLRNDYPDKIIVQNRGLFFFNPNLGHYKYNTRPYIDYLMFESFRLDSSSSAAFNPLFFADNSNYYAPKIAAEASRPDGFTVLGLSYAEGPSDIISSDTLLGKSQTGLALLQEEIELYKKFGFIPYITNGWVTLVNSFAKPFINDSDFSPPAWSSTWNADNVWPAGIPEPRVGVQSATGGKNSVTLCWDVALDENPVKYCAYYQKTPFDFDADPNLEKATKVPLLPRVGAAYKNGTGKDSFPFDATITGLESDTLYYFVIRAHDDSANENEDKNRVYKTVVTLNN